MTSTITQWQFNTITSMTELFTRYPDCSLKWTYEDYIFNSVDGGVFRPNIDNERDMMYSCYPWGLTSMGLTASVTLQRFYPGRCAFGSTVGSVTTIEGTTYGECCATGFTYSEVPVAATMSGRVARVGCVSMWTGTTIVAYRFGEFEFDFATVDGSAAMWDWPLWIAWQEKDLSLYYSETVIGPPVQGSSATTSDAASSAISSSTLEVATHPSATEPESNSNQSDTDVNSQIARLTSGQIAAVATGSIFGSLLLFIIPILFFALHKRRQRRKVEADRMGTDTEPDSGENKRGLDVIGEEEPSKDTRSTEPQIEVGQARQDLGSELKLYELDAAPREFEIYSPDSPLPDNASKS